MERIAKQPDRSGILWYYHQFQNLGDDKDIDYEISIPDAVDKQMQYHAEWAIEYRKTLAGGSGQRGRL